MCHRLSQGEPSRRVAAVRRLTQIFAVLVVASAGASAQEQRTKLASPDTEARDSQEESPIVLRERFEWIVKSTIGPKNLAAGVVIAGWGTWRDNPPEYVPHWEGYAKRYGLRLTTSGASNLMEAGLGSLWGEDPRYFRATGQPLPSRVAHVFGGAFITRNRDGSPMPAYARYIAVPSASFLSSTWRPDSQATTSDSVVRIGFGFASRIVGNAFSEFLPDLWKHKSKNPNSRTGKPKDADPSQP